MRRPSARTSVSFAVVAACVAFVLAQLEPELLLSKTTPNGGDTGAHVWAPAYLRDYLLPEARLSGWAPGAWAGFPALFFYFPLASLLIVLLDVALPYVVAFKLVTVLGVATLPVAAYLFGLLSGLRWPGPPTLAVSTLPFLFDTSFTIYGGNIPSTLAGEFAFSLGLSLALIFLGVVARGLQDGRHRALAAVLFALTALSHALPALFAVAGVAVLLLLHLDRDRLRYVLTLGAAGAAIVGFWLLPLAARLPYSNDMGWTKITDYSGALLPGHLRWILGLALVGAVASWSLRLRAGVIVLAVVVASGFLFIALPEGKIWNARFLPFWYLSVYLLAGVGASEVGRALASAISRDRERPLAAVVHATPVVALLVALVAVGGPLRALPSFLPVRAGTTSFVGDWARWNYSGYERKADWPEHRSLIRTMRGLPCGRAMWEYGPRLERYGTPMALMLLPYWTKQCISSMEGLFFESSPTVPFHFLNQAELSKEPSRAQADLPYRELDVARGVQQLKLLGVRYYMAHSPEALAQARRNPDLRPVATSAPWQIFQVVGSRLVAPLRFEPAVLTGVGDGQDEWLDVAVPWYQDSSRWPVLLAADGPSSWKRIRARESPPRTPVRPASVSRVRASEDHLSFDVDRPGSPVLVKASYFPNWKVSGAEGPWRVAPNLMVVVPRAVHVELRYGYTAVDRLGWLLTLLGLIGTAVMARHPLRFRTSAPAIERLRRIAAITAAVTALDYVVLLILRLQFDLPLVVADASAIAVAAAASYSLHRAITFADDPHARWVRRPGAVAAAILTAGAVDVAVLVAIASVVESGDLVALVAAKTLAVGAAGVVRVMTYRRWLFLMLREEQGERGGRPTPPGELRLSVIVPAYSEEHRIADAVTRIRAALTQIAVADGAEIIVIADGSPDETPERARAADQVIVLAANRGKGAAVRAGVLAARGRTVAFIDADLSYSPEQLLVLLEEVEAGWDVVVGSRRHAKTATLVRAGRLRELGGRLFNLLGRALLLGRYRDTQCGLKAFRSDTARLLFSKSRLDRFAFDVELFHLVERYHLSLTEVPVTVVHHKLSSVRIAVDAARMVWDVFRVRRWAGEGLYDLSPDEAALLEREARRPVGREASIGPGGVGRSRS